MIQIQDGKVFNSQFEDIYFSQEDGAAESDYVFLQGNDLSRRFSNLNAYECFSVGELGFGTGLNFVLTRKLFLNRAPATTRLHFYSFEIDLPSPGMCRRSLNLFSELDRDATLLRRKLRGVLQKNTGMHTLYMDEGRVRLTLILGDARKEIHQLNASCEAWFLDGFAPARNPELWQDGLFREIALRSESGATFSSFTAAGAVRKALADAGFQVERVPGYGRKKHMIRGRYEGLSRIPEVTRPANSSPEPDGENFEHSKAHRRTGDPGNAIFFSRKNWGTAGPICIVGAGLAGLSTAYALTRRGIPVTIYEADQVAGGASGNRSGMAASSLTAEPTATSLIGLRAQSMFISWLMDQSGTWKKPGFLRKREDWNRYLRGSESHSLTAVYHRKQARETLMGFSASVEPATLCQYYLEKCKESKNFRMLEGSSIKPQDVDDSESGPIWILCNANDLGRFSQAAFIAQKPVRGQVIYLPLNSSKYRNGVTNQVYLVPVPSEPDLRVLGATFDMHLNELHRLPERDEYLLSEMKEKLSDLWACLDPETMQQIEKGQLQGRVGFRSQARDYLPVCGALPDAEDFLDRFDSYYTLPGDEKKTLDYRAINQEIKRHSNLYVNACHGSRGITTSFLCAELLAAQINQEGTPLEDSLARALDPVRFLWKAVKQPPSKRPEWARKPG